MATTKLSNEFMAKVLEDAAWVKLSADFTWNEQLLEKYKDKVAWKEVSGNENIAWTSSMLEKFKNKINWDELSGSENADLFSAEKKEKFKDYWNWHELSGNSRLKLTHALLEQFADYWDWSEIIDGYRREDLYGIEFLEKYQDYIPASTLQSSRLWLLMVGKEMNRLKTLILSE